MTQCDQVRDNESSCRSCRCAFRFRVTDTNRTILPGTPLRKAAQRILHERLKAVERRVKRANQAAGEVPDAVHEVRIATRRAGAAVRVFRDLIRKGDRRKLTRRLRELRRAAAATRRADVQIELLEVARQSEPSLAPVAGEAIARINAGRAEAVRLFQQEVRRRSLKQWRRLRRRLTARLRKSAPVEGQGGIRPSFADGARHALTLLADELRVSTAAASGSDIESLHRVRLDIKRLRYSIEVFRPVLTDSAAETLDCLREAQTALGAINDLEELQQTLAGFDRPCDMVDGAPRTRPYTLLIAWARQRLTDLLDEFQSCWPAARWNALCDDITALTRSDSPRSRGLASDQELAREAPPSSNGHATSRRSSVRDEADEPDGCMIETYRACPPPPASPPATDDGDPGRIVCDRESSP